MECRLLYLVGQLRLGGLERQLVYLIRSMDRGRYKPVVAVWGNSEDDHYANDLRALDVPVIRLGESQTRLGKLKALYSLVSTCRPEVIHSYTFYTNIAAVIMVFVLFEPLGLYGRWLKIKLFFQLFPLYKRATFKRQKIYVKSERNR